MKEIKQFKQTAKGVTERYKAFWAHVLDRKDMTFDTCFATMIKVLFTFILLLCQKMLMRFVYS